MATRFHLSFRPVLIVSRVSSTVLSCLAALLCAAARGDDQNRTAPAASDALAAELAAFLAAQPKWSSSAAVEGSFGFKDNLLLSSSAEERSAFGRAGVEALVLRVPTGRVDYSLFAQTEATRYFEGRTVQNETKSWLRTELGLRASEHWKWSLPLTGYYYDQIFDVSDTEVERLVAELKVGGAMAGPTVRWTPDLPIWIETQVVEERKRYAGGVNDGRVREGALRLGWEWGEHFEIRLAGMQRRRDFDSRSQYSAAGRPLFGTELKIDEREGELRVDLKWDRAGRWRMTTRAGMRDYHDNGSGYFNYRERKLDHEMEWSDGPWRVRVEGAARRVDFDVQTVGIGIDPPARLKDEFDLGVRVEREMGIHWTLLGGFTWERSRSNDPVASYVVNEGLLGVRWSWEK